ncbi:glycoside hydrolase family 5 protein [Dendrothele bispora CBS 962.96]|uniref:glucan 1,3-beta-glucosidase n=1 Tax=Dendrothele bispora (strain CBS 962.96) TaxID=1314807 RepID=A0A4S8M9N6_DENBC|nr:glycoside hydrolase family 5 protein [Dendrothele bispora CBS 962.96]
MAPPLLHIVVVALCAAFTQVVLADDPITPAFQYGSTKVRGVNLGGWLVLEPWITPSLFDATGDSRIVDEWTFGQYQDKNVAEVALKNHWKTWITEQDFVDIKAAGLNHVRLPIGYWAFDVSEGEPFIQGQVPYLKKAVQWARNQGLKVIVDLHGAPGSQNGFDNSGQKKTFPQWQTNSDNIERTNKVLKKIAKMFADQSDVVTVIAPLNEPAGFYGDEIMDAIRQYWYDSYGSIRFPHGTSQQGNSVVLLHDAFQNTSYWDDFMPSPQWQGVGMDTHIYQIFSDAEVSRTKQQHIDNVCARGSDFASFHLWLIAGEFTPAMTDCAKYLNGRGIGARYDGTYPDSPRVGSCTGQTGKADTFNEDFKDFLRQMWEAQTITFEKGAGWVQWTWKAEVADEWSYQAGLANGWIPKDPVERMYPEICD